MTVEDFCRRHLTYKEEEEWAVSTGCATMDELWARPDFWPEWRVWVATRTGVLDARTLRLFGVWCVRQVWHLLDDSSRTAVEVAERFEVGAAKRDELDAARNAADAARTSARVAALTAWAAAWPIAGATDAARASARAALAAVDAAWAAALATAHVTDATWTAALAASWATVGAAVAASWATAGSTEAARASARIAAWTAAWTAQADYLITNTTPDFVSGK
jgi:hypothetical protein